MKKYAQSAYKVVVPEVNRAYITKTWWELSTLPSILPNKPYRIKNSGELSKDASRILEKVKNEKRKIILYQGGFTADRKFDLFAEAIRQLNNEYCLYLMGPDNQYRESICEKYPEIEYLGSLIPPEHLEVAAFSHIGILTYIPVNDGFHSSLNAQYCAPNKTFEYALKQLPMIGTDVMGLQEIFKEFNIGVCLKNESSEAVIEAIACIENNYDNMKKQCIEYYESVDLGKLLNKIIE
ncbi:hypothetical protein BO224_08355 [Erysipelotrichaceae bacterium NYU-BL-E8]|uniref:Glycosyl transferase family 1 domain-containing protein n=1 Tax=Ileibacterium valens TaxID=1862668 RepID=A0A1U7NEZ9_9FIRM|nr:hypothetical protein BM735_09315 [Erysipelotrichaceae bacterium NYU-BL-F16]OLU38514.1 hypothetical protein BO222_08275 [Ileibacterium valens]OLU38828.1 hypothetical protein BO224_08355 [Erysipelotrichaceae bacterium NYU-BL-E8]